MPITISDIAKVANVSKSAVSIVLNNKKGVSEKTRNKILDTIKRYNYNPNHIAQSLVAKETKSIGLIIKEIDNPFSSKVMKGVYDACSQLGYSVLLGSSELSARKESEIVNTMLSKRVDGLLISPLQREESDYRYLSNLLNEDYPFVILGEIINYPINIVDIDNFRAAYDAVSYLIELGHTRIGHFAGPVHSGHGQKRLEGYKQALIDNNIAIDNDFVLTVEPYILNGFMAGKELFSQQEKRPSAVFCYNDLVSIGLIDALLKLKIRVPEDVSIIGFDNIDFSKYVKIPLTTVQMPAYEIGRDAANLLIKLILNSPTGPKKKLILNHRLIKRNSCGRFIGNN